MSDQSLLVFHFKALRGISVLYQVQSMPPSAFPFILYLSMTEVVSHREMKKPFTLKWDGVISKHFPPLCLAMAESCLPKMVYPQDSRKFFQGVFFCFLWKTSG